MHIMASTRASPFDNRLEFPPGSWAGIAVLFCTKAFQDQFLTCLDSLSKACVQSTGCLSRLKPSGDNMVARWLPRCKLNDSSLLAFVRHTRIGPGVLVAALAKRCLQ